MSKATTKQKKTISISFTNNKGGVGKTTMVINLGAALAKRGYSVLLIDNDPQANLTLGVGLDKIIDFEETIYTSVKESKPVPIYETAIPNLSIVPCEINYSELEIWYSSQPFGTGYTILNKKIKEISSHYDFIFIDNAPALGAFMYNSILATDYTIVIVEGSSFAVKGLKVVLSLLENFKEQTENELIGIIINKMNNYVVRKDTAKWLRENFNSEGEELIFENTISQYVAIEESAALQQTIFDYTDQNESVNTNAKAEFEALAEELLQRVERLQQKNP